MLRFQKTIHVPKLKAYPACSGFDRQNNWVTGKLQEPLLPATGLFNELSYIDMQVRNKAKHESEKFGLGPIEFCPF